MKKIVAAIIGVIALVALGLVIYYRPCCMKKGKIVKKDDLVLLKIDGQPVVVQSEFYKELSAMVRGMDPTLLPKDAQKKFLEDLTKFELVVAAAKRDGLEKDEEYAEAYREQKERLKKALLSRVYEKKLFDGISVSEADMKADYEKNKLRYVKEQGGVLVSCVAFDDHKKAMRFYGNVKGSMNEFASIGKKEKDGRFREFGRVSAEQGEMGYMGPTKAVRDAALKLSRLPGVDVVKDGKETYVIHVSDKKDAVVFSYMEIRDQVENQLKVKKFMSVRNAKYEELKNSFDVETNEEFFATEDPAKEAPSAA